MRHIYFFRFCALIKPFFIKAIAPPVRLYDQAEKLK